MTNNGRQKPPPRSHGSREPFLNPYTFVPAFPRNETGPLGDKAPLGHDRLRSDRWSGSIAVTLTVRTPLLLLDSARATRADTEEEHLVYPVLSRDGRPHLPATSLKGMLRSAYEAITNSRFGVFDSEADFLGWRRPAGDALRMRAARVSDDGARLEFCTAVRVRAYPPEQARRYPDKRIPEHGDKVWVRIERQGKANTVVDIRKDPGNGAPRPSGWRSGYAFVSRRNAIRKKYESVFIPDPGAPAIGITEDLRDHWNDLIRSYRGVDRPNGMENKGRWIADEPGKLAWSPHLWDDKNERHKLKPGTLCYALVEKYRGEEVVLGLYPVAIPRDVSGDRPTDKLPDGLAPAPSFGKLSPADRVFGWVTPKGSGVRPAAYRGHLRIRNVRCASTVDESVARFGAEGLPLAILGQPKPSQGRFYLSKSAETPDEPLKDGISKEEIYWDPDHGLRGRKVYWHHAHVADSPTYWQGQVGDGDPTQELVDGKGYREYRRPRAPRNGSGEPALIDGGTAFDTTDQEQRDNQNRSVRGWVNKGTRFTFTLDVTDLDGVELGALVWLLSMEPDELHRLGLGKPLGFGSVHLEIDRGATTLHTGDNWAAYYRDLRAAGLPEAGPDAALDGTRSDFEALLRPGSHLNAAAEAFRTAARGMGDLPVRYPRVRPHVMAPGQTTPPDPRGLSYEWFTANEKIAGKEIAHGRGRSLPSTQAPRSRALDTYLGERLKRGNGS